MRRRLHGGKFHADDVFSAALLLYLNPEINYARQQGAGEFCRDRV